MEWSGISPKEKGRQVYLLFPLQDKTTLLFSRLQETGFTQNKEIERPVYNRLRMRGICPLGPCVPEKWWVWERGWGRQASVLRVEWVWEFRMVTGDAYTSANADMSLLGEEVPIRPNRICLCSGGEARVLCGISTSFTFQPAAMKAPVSGIMAHSHGKAQHIWFFIGRQLTLGHRARVSTSQSNWDGVNGKWNPQIKTITKPLKLQETLSGSQHRERTLKFGKCQKWASQMSFFSMELLSAREDTA